MVVEPLEVLADVAQQTLMNEQQALAGSPIAKPPSHRMLRGVVLETMLILVLENKLFCF